MGGKEHPQSPNWASGQACGNIVLVGAVNHQSHQELVSPGDAKGWREALLRSPETRNGCRSCTAHLTPMSAMLRCTHSPQ